MNILRILLCATLLIAFVDAQRKLNLSKPIINLEKPKPPPTWQRPAEERRKLSIFPKTTTKYMITLRSVVKTDDETVGSPKQIPLMREFVVEDKNNKGSWYFAPREPLMKTIRFTVTEAPPRNSRIEDSRNANKPYDEIGEESKIIKTVILKPVRELNKLRINKGNVVNAIQNEKDNLSKSKGFKSVENVVEEAKLDNQLINQSFKTNDVIKEESPELLYDSYQIDMRNFKSAETNHTGDNHEETNKNEHIKIIESTPPFNTVDILYEGIESRSLDGEMALIDLSKHNFNRNTSSNDTFINLMKTDVIAEETKKIKSEFPIFLENDTDTIKEYTTEPVAIKLESETSTNIPDGDISDQVHDKSSSLNGTSEYIENIQNVSADEIPVEAIRNRYKRSNNIIEEEHQATTITVLKYTGQPTRLSQDLSFKNINA